MKKHFYSHIIEVESIFTRLHLLDLEDHQRHELITLVESSIHYEVMDTVLSKLSEEDKKRLLSHIATEKHEDIWKLLNEKVKNAEGLIRRSVDNIKKKFHDDIGAAKTKKK